MADLITLERFKAAQDNFPDPTLPDPQDDQFAVAISAASALVRSYTGLDFELSSATPTSRDYEYDGAGWLDIDPAQTITSVAQKAGYIGATSWTLTTDQWGAYPLNDVVKRWLRMPFAIGGISPAMGFTYNLDTLAYKYPEMPSIVTVTARFGWPEIPDDIQYAVVVTAQSMIDSPNTYQSETIESYSRTKAFSTANDDPIPPKARAALAPYLVPNI